MTREVAIGNTAIGAGNRIAVQSMLNRPSSDIEGNVLQAIQLEKAGCDINRVSIPDEKAVALIGAIKEKSAIPLVADIHFDYRLAIKSAEAGVDKIRFNPGNIGSEKNAKMVVDCCRAHGIPIRVGVNSGSLEKALLAKYGGVTSEALCESALRHVRLIEDCGYDKIVISMKSTDIRTMVGAYRLAAGLCDYPLHLGVTEAGTRESGTIKSAIGIGALLLEGIGDTIRVSLTDEPVNEITAGKTILKALDLAEGVRVISCPTCGRTDIDVIAIAKEIECATSHIKQTLSVAVMGCVVNGPGEASRADIGIAGGRDSAVLFKSGEVLRVIKSNYAEELLKEIEVICGE